MKRRKLNAPARACALDDAKLDRVGGGFGAGSEWGWSDQWDEPALDPGWYSSSSGSDWGAHELAHATDQRRYSSEPDSWW